MPAPYLVLAVPGTGESYPGDTRTAVTGMIANITGKVDPSQYESRWVAYDASYGFVPMPTGVSYAESVQQGLSALLTALYADTRPVFLIGYSQGSTVVSAFLDLLAAGHYPDLKDRIAGAVLLANPARPDGAPTLGPRHVGSYGITYDPKNPTPARVVPAIEVANPQDGICSAAPDSFLRDLAIVTEFMSFVDLATWGQSLLTAAEAIDWKALATAQNLDLVYQFNRFSRSVGEAVGYVTGRHTAYNVENVPGTVITYTDLAAKWIDMAAAAYGQPKDQPVAA
jgi:pimeloyl-ACP methyl ester carboxylesterase